MTLSPEAHSALLSQALTYAYDAVQLDNALQLEAAYFAYWHSLDIICQVMDALKPLPLRTSQSRVKKVTFYDSDSGSDSDPYIYGGLGLESEGSSTSAEESDEGVIGDDEAMISELAKLRCIYDSYRERMLLLAPKIQASYGPDSSPSSNPRVSSTFRPSSGCQSGHAAAIPGGNPVTRKLLSSFWF